MVNGRVADTAVTLSVLLLAALALGGVVGCNGEPIFEPDGETASVVYEARTTLRSPPPNPLLLGGKGLIETPDLTYDSLLPRWLTFASGAHTLGVTQASLTIQVAAMDYDMSQLQPESAFTLTVDESNNPPTAPALQPQTWMEGRENSYTVPEFTDPEGGAVTYTAAVVVDTTTESLPSWLSFNQDTRTFNGTPQHADTPVNITIRVTATDDASPPLTNSATFTLSVPDINQSPPSPSVSDQIATIGSLFTYQFAEVTDPDGDTLIYNASLSNSSPVSTTGWLDFDASTRTFSGTPRVNVVSLNDPITIQVSADDTGGLSGRATFTVTVVANQAPSAPTIEPQTATEDVSFDFTVPEFVDPEGGTVDYSVVLATGTTLADGTTPADGTDLPDWLTFNADSRILSGTPADAVTPATLMIRITASDDGMPVASSSVTFTLHVREVNVAPVAVDDTISTAVDEGGTLVIQSTVLLDNDTDADVPANTLTITAVGNPPNGNGAATLSDDGTTITYTHDGSETTSGSFTYIVSDGYTPTAGTDTATVTITVTPVNDAPVSDSGLDQIVTSGSTVTLDGSGSNDSDSSTLTYTWSQISGDYVTLSSTAVAMPTFTSPVVLQGETSFTLEFSLVVNDGTLDSAADAVTITVLPPRVPGIPQDLSLAEGHRQITVSWDAPSDVGSPALTGYSVQYREVSSSEVPWQTWIRPTAEVATSTTTVITGLTNDVVYQVQVAAVNSQGTGSYTTPRSITPRALRSIGETASSGEQPPNLYPDFGDHAVDDHVWSQDQRVELSLPVANGGDGELRYHLSPALPAGLRFDADGRSIIGTPTETMARTRFTFMAIDQDGDRAELRFFITVIGLPPVDVPDPEGGAPTLVVTRTGEASVTLTLGDETMEVRVTADIENEGMRLTLQADPALESLAEIEFTEVTDTEVLGAELPSGFRIDGSQAVVNITLMDEQGDLIRELDNAATVCLPVNDSMLVEEGEQKLTLLHYDETDGWTTLADSEVRTLTDDMMVVCAETTRFSLFAVGYGEEPAATATSTQSPTPTPVPSLISTSKPTVTPTPTATTSLVIPPATPIPTATPTPTLVTSPTRTQVPVATPAPTAMAMTTPATSHTPPAVPLSEDRESDVNVWIWVMIGLLLANMVVAGAIVILMRAWHRRG